MPYQLCNLLEKRETGQFIGESFDQGTDILTKSMSTVGLCMFQAQAILQRVLSMALKRSLVLGWVGDIDD